MTYRLPVGKLIFKTAVFKDLFCLGISELKHISRSFWKVSGYLTNCQHDNLDLTMVFSLLWGLKIILIIPII